MKIIKVSSLWCPSCIVLDEKLKTINDVEIESLDYDEDETVVKTYNVEILPTLIFVNNAFCIKNICNLGLYKS